MKSIKTLGMIAVMLVAGVASAFAQQKPHVYILATGGTIAGTGASATASGYTAGQVAIQSLIDAVPQIKDVADVTGEQIVNIGSQDMNDQVWLTLAKRINELLATDAVDGIVITHGTDTMEETAYFLTVHSDKPVVLTGAMRPSTAMSADGPLNLYNSVVTAADPSSKGRGVMVVMNGIILGAHGTQKMNTVDVQTFQDPDGGKLGYIYNSKPYYILSTLKKHTTESVFDVTNLDKLPKVGIVYAYSNIEADIMTPFLDKANGYQGVIHAGLGNGNYHKNIFPTLLEARKQGIIVVRSSRVPTGPTTLYDEVDDAKYQFVASWELNPQKARVLLMLALTKTNDWQQIQKYFEEY